MRVLIIGAHGRPLDLVAAIRTGAVIEHIPLAAKRPAWEDARAEAERRWPGAEIVIPALGEHN